MHYGSPNSGCLHIGEVEIPGAAPSKGLTSWPGPGGFPESQWSSSSIGSPGKEGSDSRKEYSLAAVFPATREWAH